MKEKINEEDMEMVNEIIMENTEQKSNQLNPFLAGALGAIIGYKFL